MNYPSDYEPPKKEEKDTKNEIEENKEEPTTEDIQLEILENPKEFLKMAKDAEANQEYVYQLIVELRDLDLEIKEIKAQMDRIKKLMS